MVYYTLVIGRSQKSASVADRIPDESKAGSSVGLDVYVCLPAFTEMHNMLLCIVGSAAT